MKWISFVDIVDFVEVVVVAVDPEPHGVEGNGDGLNLTPMEMGRESPGLKMGRITMTLKKYLTILKTCFTILKKGGRPQNILFGQDRKRISCNLNKKFVFWSFTGNSRKSEILNLYTDSRSTRHRRKKTPR